MKISSFFLHTPRAKPLELSGSDIENTIWSTSKLYALITIVLEWILLRCYKYAGNKTALRVWIG
jgi:hypothetical protein